MSAGFQSQLNDASLTLDGNRVFIKNRLVGWLATNSKGARIFVSPRRRADHYFRSYCGWGISAELLQYLKRKFVQEIQIKLSGEPDLAASVFCWIKYGMQTQQANFEPQLILAETYFKPVQESTSFE